MKTIRRISSVVILMTCVMSCLSSLKAQMFYHNSHLFMGTRPNAWENVSTGPGVYLGPDFGIEFYDNGINFWRPYGGGAYPGNYKMFLDQSGKLGINRKPTTYALEVNGQVWTTSGLLITSDQKFKRNIVNINDDSSNYLDKLKKLNGKSYEKMIYINKASAEEISEMVSQGKIKQEDASVALQLLNREREEIYKKEFGFIAQEVKEVFPELVEESADGISAVNYTGFIPVLLEAIKELQQKVEALESQKELLTIETRSSLSTMNDEIDLPVYYLSQNTPNPVRGSAQINYSLPEGARNASIVFYSLNGTAIKNQPLDVQQSTGSISVLSADFTTGMYIYRLLVNGMVLGTKKMIIQ